MANTVRGIGGRKFVIDERDQKFRMSVILKDAPKTKLPTGKVYDCGPILDQKGLKCIGYTARALLTYLQDGKQTGPSADQLYDDAKARDELGPDDPNSTTRAGLKALQDRKAIKNYYWAETIGEVRLWLLGERGPLFAGSDWTEGMLKPDRYGFVKPTGKVVAGHAYVVDGWDDFYNAVRVHLSSGPAFGLGGFVYISGPDFEKLLAPDKGEAAGVVR